MALAGTLSAPLAEAAEDRSWVERSDRISAIVFESLGPFQPEQASALGLERFDTAALDLKPGRTTPVERGAPEAIYRAPQHEYTRKLLAAIPRGLEGRKFGDGALTSSGTQP